MSLIAGKKTQHIFGAYPIRLRDTFRKEIDGRCLEAASFAGGHMDLFDRIYRFDRVLKQARYPVSRPTLQGRLECSRATFNRIVREMKEYLGAPIEYDRKYNGYRYAPTGGHPYELPGLWFNASELHALLACQQLLASVQPGLLDEHLAPLRTRIEHILAARHLGTGEVGRRIRILSMAARRTEPAHFSLVAGALLQRRRLHLRYRGRARNEETEREVSPQRLVHYRDNWYLDVWDHGKRALRTFAVERIRGPRVLDEHAKDISEERLNRYFTESYGIFSGRPKRKAMLRFSPDRSRWVADETWHPQQKGRYENGYYILEIPYSDDRELVLDILKHGPDVEVLSPKSLRDRVLEQLVRATSQYRR